MFDVIVIALRISLDNDSMFPMYFFNIFNNDFEKIYSISSDEKFDEYLIKNSNILGKDTFSHFILFIISEISSTILISSFNQLIRHSTIKS